MPKITGLHALPPAAGAQASPFRIARLGFSISFDRNYFCDKVFPHIRLANLKINL
jgi:hypothetical protein